MTYYTIAPPPMLANCVRYFWVLENDGADAMPYVHRSMADGCAELIFHYKGVFDELNMDGSVTTSISSGIAGPSKTFSRFSINGAFGIFGVYLYPFALTNLFAVPAETLKNQLVGLDVVVKEDAPELEDKMMLANGNEERVNIISAFLQSKLSATKKQPSGIAETIQQVIHGTSNIDISMLAKQNFLSLRQFERHFKSYAGFSPKLYSRIIRFQKVLNHYQKQELTLTQLAYDAGYYDQSHFIQDFKEFSGHTPKAYFSGATESTIWRDE